MAKKHDTDTLTKIDSSPDAPTLLQGRAASEAPTHKLEPGAFAPLRVCPECSRAWETSNRWCPSCGTAFERSLRESSTATRVMPRRPTEPPLSRSARRGRELRGAAAEPPRQRPPAGPPVRQKPQGGAGAFVRNASLALLATVTVVAAFFVGQATRPSQAQVDASIEQAVATAKQSAANSYRTAFEKIQAEAAVAIEAARKRGVAEGQSTAAAEIEAQQQSSRGLFDKVTDCVLRAQC